MVETIVVSERIDRNGTKHQEIITACSRCGGAGKSSRWMYTGSVCYKCGGNGRENAKRKIYTPEHQAKLDLQREKREEKKRQERIQQILDTVDDYNAEFKKKYGYDQEKIFSVLSDNTYEIKDELKSAGAMWGGRALGWYFSEKPLQWQTIELEVSLLIEFDNYGRMNRKNLEEETAYVRQERKKILPESKWVGKVGDRLDLILKVVFSFDIDGMYGDSSINTLVDSEGNKFTWKTQRNLCDNYGTGSTIQVRGTVKEHSEYNDEKQTVLTRCKISGE